MAQSLISHVCGGIEDFGELAVRVLVYLRDGGARENIVKLVQEQRLPAPLQGLTRLSTAVQSGDGGERFGFEQPVLRRTIECLNLPLGGERSPVQLEVELADPLREVFFGQRRVEIFHPRHAEARQSRKALESLVVLEHLLARTAATVTPPEGEEALGMAALLFEVAPGPQQVERTDDPIVV